MRVRAHVPATEPHPLEQRLHPLLALAAPRELVDEHGLADDRARRHPRIERRVGVLEDHLHLLAIGHHPHRVEIGDVFAVHADAALGRLEQLEHGPADRGLAAARLADEPQRLAAPDVKRDPVDGPYMSGDSRKDSPADRKELLQLVNVQNRRAFGGEGRSGDGCPGEGRSGDVRVHGASPRSRSACQHATQCPGRCSRCGGKALRHSSLA